MPLLTLNQKRRLDAYRTDRNGQEIPGTSHGSQHYSAACWSWALTGGFIDDNNPNSAGSIYSAIIASDFIPDPRDALAILGTRYATRINDVDSQFKECGMEFKALRRNLEACREADQPAFEADEAVEKLKAREAGKDEIEDAEEKAKQSWKDVAGSAMTEKTLFKQAMMGICARRNGLAPCGAGSGHAYTLHMRTSRWYGWDHWGIGIQTLSGNTINYIQTVPNTAIWHACNIMWDEHMSLTSIGIAGLHQSHIDVIDKISLAPVRSAKCHQTGCNQQHGWWLSITNHWHRCTSCGTVWCPVHGGGLAGKAWSSPTRTCSVCGSRTELLT